MKCEIHIIWNHLVTQLCPRTAAESGTEREARIGGRRENPRAQTGHIFFSVLHEYHFYFQEYIAKTVVNTNMKVTKVNEIHVTKKKQIETVFIEIQHWWYFSRKFSYHNQSYKTLTIVFCCVQRFMLLRSCLYHIS